MFIGNGDVQPLRILFHLTGAVSFQEEIRETEPVPSDWPEWWPHSSSEKPSSFANALFSVKHIQRYLDASSFGREPVVTFDKASSRWECIVDPLGRVNLFYGVRNNELVVSSSIHEICLALDAWDADQQMIAEYITSGNVFSFEPSRTFVSQVHQVGVGRKLVYEKGIFKIEASDLIRNGPRNRVSHFRDAIRLVRNALDETVTTVIEKHQTVGCLFSGGVDSCAIAATAVRLEPALGHRTVLLNAGNDLGTAEEKFLREEFCNFTERTTTTVDQSPKTDIFATLEAMNRIANFPVGCPFSGIFESIAQRAVEAGCTVLVSGDGGDELFGHNPFWLVDLELNNPAKFIEAIAINRLRPDFNNLLSFRAYRFLSRFPYSTRRRFSEWMGRVISNGTDDKSLATLLGPFYEQCRSLSAHAFNLYDQIGSGWRMSDQWHFRQALQIPSYEPNFDYLAPRFASSTLCAASPFLTLPMLEAACSLPIKDRFGLGIGSFGKALLRYSVADRLPSSVAFHRKIGSSDAAILNQILTTQWQTVTDALTSYSLRRIGIIPSAQVLGQRSLMDTSVNWFRLVVLSTWLQQLERHRQTKGGRH